MTTEAPVQIEVTDVTVETTTTTTTPQATTTTTPQATTTTPQEEEDAGFKIFVGNLSFQTTEEELANFFTPAGKVLKANIITRGARSLGYGFVAFETSAEAEKATTELNKKELGGREINVEVAKPKVEGEARHRGRGDGPARGRAVRRGRGRGRGNPSRKGWSGPRRFNRRREPDVEGGNQNANIQNSINDTNAKDGWNQNNNTTSNNDDGWGPPVPVANVNESWNENQFGENRETAEPREPKKRAKPNRRRGGGRPRGRGSRPIHRERRERREPGEPSKTTVFVANLPFSTDDEGLKALFKDYNIKSAHVVKRRTGRSKGFGFVDLVDEEEQKKVLEGMKGAKADERELVIKVALSEPHVQEKENENAPVISESDPVPTSEVVTTAADQ